MIHKDGLRSVDVQQVPAAKWYELLETLSYYGQLVLADGGLSPVSPAAVGTLARADHVLLAVEADAVVIQKTLEAVNEVMAGDPDMQALLLGATVVVAYTNPFDRLTVAVQDVYLRIALHLAQCFHRPARTTCSPAGAAAIELPPTTKLAAEPQAASPGRSGLGELRLMQRSGQEPGSRRAPEPALPAVSELDAGATGPFVGRAGG